MPGKINGNEIHFHKNKAKKKERCRKKNKHKDHTGKQGEKKKRGRTERKLAHSCLGK